MTSLFLQPMTDKPSMLINYGKSFASTIVVAIDRRPSVRYFNEVKRFKDLIVTPVGTTNILRHRRVML